MEVRTAQTEDEKFSSKTVLLYFARRKNIRGPISSNSRENVANAVRVDELAEGRKRLNIVFSKARVTSTVENRQWQARRIERCHLTSDTIGKMDKVSFYQRNLRSSLRFIESRTKRALKRKNKREKEKKSLTFRAICQAIYGNDAPIKLLYCAGLVEHIRRRNRHRSLSSPTATSYQLCQQPHTPAFSWHFLQLFVRREILADRSSRRRSNHDNRGTCASCHDESSRNYMEFRRVVFE